MTVKNIMKVDILGIKVDQVNLSQAVEKVSQWLDKGKGERVKGKVKKHYIVTPNPEIIMAAQTDIDFKNILNQADLAIADSTRIGWAQKILSMKSIVKKILFWPFFIIPKIVVRDFDIVAGVDLMDELIKKAHDQGFAIGLLGGGKNVAEKLRECLTKKYPKLKITFCSDGGIIDKEGNIIFLPSILYPQSSITIPPTDILFVALGHIKQEKWISKNLSKYPVKVMMGVGGAFDYLSGNVPRAPKLIQNLGFEWLFRLFVQPWRIRRFGSLVKFVFKVIIYKSSQKPSHKQS